MKTNYAKALDEFMKSLECEDIEISLSRYGIEDKIIDSIIKNIFEAAWNASGVKTEVITETNNQ